MKTQTKNFFAFISSSDSKTDQKKIEEALENIKLSQNAFEAGFKGSETILSISDVVVGNCLKRTVVYLLEEPAVIPSKLLEDIRNKLSPMKNLFASMKLLKIDLLDEQSRSLWEIVKRDVEVAKKNLEYIENVTL